MFDIAASAIHYPFFYSSEERPISGRWRCRKIFDPSGRLAEWARGFVRGSHTDTLALLKDMVAGWRRGSATRAARKKARRRRCRRSIAAGARAATSPCCSPRRRAAWASARGSSRAISTIPSSRCRTTPGSTHAWAEIFLPGAGWITFDPTNRGVGGYNLIPLAVGRIIAQVMPMTGTFLGMTDAYLGMSVDVELTAE